jgi:PPOX class probable F420-dependent enzyme
LSHLMTEAEARRFLAEGTRTAAISTTRSDGRPHVAPVWFALDGDDLLFTTGAETVKGRNLLRDARVCLSVDDAHAPYAYVVVEGTVTTTEEPAELLRWATIIARRYVGDDLAEEFGRRYGVAGEMVVRVTPTKITGEGGVID